jgi:hypothetical protein
MEIHDVSLCKAVRCRGGPSLVHFEPSAPNLLGEADTGAAFCPFRLFFHHLSNLSVRMLPYYSGLCMLSTLSLLGRCAFEYPHMYVSSSSCTRLRTCLLGCIASGQSYKHRLNMEERQQSDAAAMLRFCSIQHQTKNRQV